MVAILKRLNRQKISTLNNNIAYTNLCTICWKVACCFKLQHFKTVQDRSFITIMVLASVRAAARANVSLRNSLTTTNDSIFICIQIKIVTWNQYNKHSKQRTILTYVPWKHNINSRQAWGKGTNNIVNLLRREKC